MKVNIDSESAVTLALGGDIALKTHLQVMALAGAVQKNPFPGLLDIVPAYAALTVHFDPVRIRQQVPGEVSPAAFVVRTLTAIARRTTETVANTSVASDCSVENWTLEMPIFTIPVRYGGAEGPDLAEVANQLQQTEQDIVRLHVEALYRVFMIGFLPGFPYLGPLPAALMLPRRAVPRLKVPAGSVAIAGRQTGVYPQDSPGGWHVIGRTDVRLFDPGARPPALLRPGMAIRFISC